MTSTQKQKTIWIALITFILFLLGLDALVPNALAATVTGNDYIQEIAEKLDIFHQFFSPLINFFSTQIGSLLGSDHFYLGAPGDMLSEIKNIALPLANIALAAILIGKIFLSIFSDLFGEEVDLKKEMVKIAGFFILIHLAPLGVKVVLDVSNVATNAVFSIPASISNSSQIDLGICSIDNQGRVKGPCKPTASYFVATADIKNTQNLTSKECRDQKIEEAYRKSFPNGPSEPPAPNADPELLNKSTFCWGKLDLFDYNQNTAVVYLTYGMANIQNLGVAHSNTGSFSKMAIASLFSLLIQVTYTVALLALFIFMLVRMAVLWIFIGFSPLIVLMFYFGGGEGPIPNFGPKDFFKWAFSIPVQVALILTVGFLLISAGRSSSEFMMNLNQTANLKTAFYDPISIFSGMDTIFDLIWLIMIEIIFAIAVYAPMKEMPFAGSLIGPISDFAKSTLTSLAKTPLIAPIIPVTDSSGNRDYVSFRDLNQSFKSKIEWRTGASADVKLLNHLEEKAKEFGRMSSNATEVRDIVGEAKSNKVITLRKYIDVDKLREVDEDHQHNILTEAGIKEKSDRDDVIRALRTSRLSATSTNTPAPPSPTTPPTEPVTKGEREAPKDK